MFIEIFILCLQINLFKRINSAFVESLSYDCSHILFHECIANNKERATVS